MVDTADPICIAADLFHMEDYILIAHQEREAFHRILEKCAIPFVRKNRKGGQRVSRSPLENLRSGICDDPLPSAQTLSKSMWCLITGHIVQTIRKYGGFARLHSHGKIRDALPHIVAMGSDATDPIEPPPTGERSAGRCSQGIWERPHPFREHRGERHREPAPPRVRETDCEITRRRHGWRGERIRAHAHRLSVWPGDHLQNDDELRNNGEAGNRGISTNSSFHRKSTALSCPGLPMVACHFSEENDLCK